MIGGRRFMVAVAILSMLLMALPISALDVRAASGPQESMLIDVRLDGPDVIGAGLPTEFTLRVSYIYPERIQSFGYSAKIIGTNTVGASLTPNNGTGTSGQFSLSITGAASTGKMTIEINASASETDAAWYRVVDFDLNVVRPVYIDAVLLNTGSAPARNVSVKMFVDDVLQGTKTYNISENSSLSVNFTWVFGTIPQGKHTVKLVIDDANNIVEFSRGDNVVSVDVYFSDSGNAIRGVMAILLMFVGLVLFLTIIQKGSKKKK